MSSRRNDTVSRAAETASKTRLHMDRNPQTTRINDPSNPAGRRKEIDNVMKRARQASPNSWDRKLLEVEEKDPNRWRHTGYKQLYLEGSPSSRSSPPPRRSRTPLPRRSRSPIGLGRRSRSPIGLGRRSRSPIGLGRRSRSPIGLGRRSRSPIGLGRRSRSPIGLGRRSRSPIGLGRRSRSPIGLGRRSRSPMGLGRRSRSPIGLGRRSRSPIGLGRRSPAGPRAASVNRGAKNMRRSPRRSPRRLSPPRRMSPARSPVRRRSPRPRTPPSKPAMLPRRASPPPARGPPRAAPRPRPPAARPPSPPGPRKSSSGSSMSSCSDESCSVCSAKNKRPKGKPRSKSVSPSRPVKRPERPPPPKPLKPLSKPLNSGNAAAKPSSLPLQPTRELLKAREASKRSREEKVLEWQRSQLGVQRAPPPAAPIPPRRIKREGEREAAGAPGAAGRGRSGRVSPEAVAAALAGEDDEDESTASSDNQPQRLTLSERFGKMAQWSADRSARLENMRITRRSAGLHVRIEPGDAAPAGEAEPPEAGIMDPAPVGSYPEELLAVAPGGLPSWDDVRVRYDYYKKRGYLRGLTLSDYVKWEEWWYKYQEWLKRERAYERWADGEVRRERRRRGGRHRRRS